MSEASESGSEQSSNRRTLIVAAILLLLTFLVAIYFIFFNRSEESTSVATLYLVDTSLRMNDTYSESNASRLETAQAFVRDLVGRSSNESIIGLRVFGNGSNEIQCEDTELLVQPNTGTQGLVTQQLASVDPASEDAPLVAAAIAAIRDLAAIDFEGVLRLVIITGGSGTCLVESANLITQEADREGIELETVFLTIGVSDEELRAIPGLVPDAPVIELDPDNIDEALEAIDDFVNNPEDDSGESFEELATVSASLPTAVPPTETPTPTLPPPPTIAPTATPTVTPTPTEEPTVTPNPPTEEPTELPTETVTPTGTVTPTPSQTLTPSATPTLIVLTETPTAPPPTFNSPRTLSIAGVAVNEAAGTVTISVLLSGLNSNPVTVQYTTSDGSATSGIDYISTSGTLSWAANEVGLKQIEIQILNDNVAEAPESFNVTLFSPVNASITTGQATVTINDDEAATVFIIPTALNLREGNQSQGFTISLEAQPSGTTTVPLTSSLPSQCQVPSQVVLDSSNWQGGVSVPITISDNGDVANTPILASCVIVTGDIESSDGRYDGQDPSDVTITVFDNDALYVDQDCIDSDGNGVCDNGIVYQNIQRAIDANSNQPLILIVNPIHTEIGVTATRDVTIRGLGRSNTIWQAAAAPQSASSRLLSIPSSFTISLEDMSVRHGFAASTPGGAILNEGTLSVNQVQFSDNASGTTGGAIFNALNAQLSVSNSIFSGNSDGVGSGDGLGGAISNAGASTLSNTIFDSNRSNPDSGIGVGGAIYNAGTGSLNISGGTFNGNQASQFGGAISNFGSLTISGATFTNNQALASGEAEGGAIHSGAGASITLQQSTLNNNRSNHIGGGISTHGTASVEQTSINGNVAQNQGGGVYNSGSGQATISRSTLSNNMTENGHGGGFFTFGNVIINNSTFSANSATGDGGALYRDGGSVTINNATITLNQAANGGGIWGTTTVRNTILAENSAAGIGVDCVGTLESGDYNLIGNVTGCIVVGASDNNLTGVSPSLAFLSNNGGSTLTHLPDIGSPVIDAGNPDSPGGSSSSCNTIDQRGVIRPQGTRCDIGAVEIN